MLVVVFAPNVFTGRLGNTKTVDKEESARLKVSDCYLTDFLLDWGFIINRPY
jgi:hypothetical protein